MKKAEVNIEAIWQCPYTKCETQNGIYYEATEKEAKCNGCERIIKLEW